MSSSSIAVLPPVRAEFITGIGKSIAAVPADEVMIIARPAIVSQEPTGGARRAAHRHTQSRHVVFGVCWLGMPELYYSVQGLEDVHFLS